MDEILIPPQSQKNILDLSRRSLESFVRGIESQNAPVDDPYLQTQLYGLFVSLHRKQELRGCVGTCKPRDRLCELLVEMTQAAASRDTRMTPITTSELDEITIDVSVLSPLVRTESPMSLMVGKHGLHVARGRQRGVLLPQVPIQYGWDIRTFLEQTCVKAGLPQDAWADPDTEVSAFTALVIEETK